MFPLCRIREAKGSICLPYLIAKGQERLKICALFTQRLNRHRTVGILFSQGIMAGGYVQGPALSGPCVQPGLRSPHPPSPVLAPLVTFYKAHCPHTSCALPSMARLSRRLHSGAALSEVTPLLSLPEDPHLWLVFFTALCFSFRAGVANRWSVDHGWSVRSERLATAASEHFSLFVMSPAPAYHLA